MSPRLAHKVELNARGEGAELLAAPQQLRDGLPALLAVVARVLVHVHPDEAVGELSVDPSAETERVLHRLSPVVETRLNRLAQHLGELVQDLRAEVAPRDVDPERQRQTGLEKPPLAEVDDLPQTFGAVGELTLVDQQAGVRPARLDLVEDLVERNFAEAEVAKEESQDEERRRHPAGHRDLERLRLLARKLLTSDHDRAVAGS